MSDNQDTKTELSPAAARVLARLNEAGRVCVRFMPMGPDVTNAEVVAAIQWLYDRIEQQELLDAAKAEGGGDL